MVAPVAVVAAAAVMAVAVSVIAAATTSGGVWLHHRAVKAHEEQHQALPRMDCMGPGPVSGRARCTEARVCGGGGVQGLVQRSVAK